MAKWQSPYEIRETKSDDNYQVYQPGKRKPFQICHGILVMFKSPISHSVAEARFWVKMLNADITLRYKVYLLFYVVRLPLFSVLKIRELSVAKEDLGISNWQMHLKM